MRFFIKRHLTYDKYYGLFNWEFFEVNRDYEGAMEISEGILAIKNFNKVRWDRCAKQYFEGEKLFSQEKHKEHLELLIGHTKFMRAIKQMKTEGINTLSLKKN